MLTTIDNITIVLCVIGIFWISRTMGKRSADMESFYHANKSLPWSLAVGTIAASWYGGNGTIGTVGYATSMGIAAFFLWSIGAHLVRFPLALWIAPKISIKVNSTMTELLERFYGRLASIIGAVVLIVSCLSISEVAATGYGCTKRMLVEIVWIKNVKLGMYLLGRMGTKFQFAIQQILEHLQHALFHLFGVI